MDENIRVQRLVVPARGTQSGDKDHQDVLPADAGGEHH